MAHQLLSCRSPHRCRVEPALLGQLDQRRTFIARQQTRHGEHTLRMAHPLRRRSSMRVTDSHVRHVFFLHP